MINKMKFMSFATALCLSVSTFSVLHASANTTGTNTIDEGVNSIIYNDENYQNPYHPDRVIVGFKEGCIGFGATASENFEMTLVDDLTKAKTPDWVKEERGELSATAGEESLFKRKTMLYKLTKPGKEEVIKIIKELRKNPNVAYAEPDYIIENAITNTPNDAKYSKLYNMDIIQAPEAWETVTGNWNIPEDSSPVVVGVIDTGIDYTHEDLKDNMWINKGEIADNGLDDDGNGYVDDIHGYNFADKDSNPTDDNGHGTHVAGIIGAIGNNEVGVCGVNWNIKLAAIKIMSSKNSASTSDIISAINYSTAMGFPITNNSYKHDFYSEAFKESISKSGLYVCSAGNEARDIDAKPKYPSSFDCSNIICVANTDSSDNLNLGSNFGTENVDIAAPGTNILSTFPGNKYAYKTGTSMASPHVAGAAALIKVLVPNATSSYIKEKIFIGANIVESLKGQVASGRRLNIYRTIYNLSKQALEVVDTMDSSKMNLGTKLPQQLKRDFSIHMWVKPGSTQNKYANIIDFDHSKNNGLVIQQVENDLNNYSFCIGNGTTSTVINYKLQADQWQHIAFQRNKNTLSLFVNGKLIESASCFEGDISLPYGVNATLGYNENFSSRDFNGEIRGIRFFNNAITENIIRTFMFNSPVSFNGTSDGINLGANSNLTPKNNFTIEMWVKPKNTQKSYANILDFNHRSNSGMVIQQYSSTTNKFYLGLSNGTTSSTIACQLQADIWQHVAFVREGTTLSLYINGKLQTTSSCFSGEIPYLENPEITVGYNQNYGRHFNGEINGLKIASYAKTHTTINNTINICSFSYNGLNQGVNTGSQVASRIKKEFAVSMWIKPNSTQQKYANILDLNHRANVGFVVQQNGSNTNKYDFSLGNGTTSSSLTYQFKSDEWQYVSFQRKGTRLELYVNGVIVATGSCFSDDVYYSDDSNLTIGYNANYGRYFNGHVRNVLVTDFLTDVRSSMNVY